MRIRISMMILGLLAMFFTCGAGGCGETTYESSSYYYPNWMPDGRIVCYKMTSRWSNALWGRKELGDANYIAAITINSSNEITREENLFEVSGGVEEITCSPTGELIGYISNPSNIGDLTISSYAGTGKTIIPGVTGVSYFDWSPDATKIAYSANRKLYVINIDGTNNTQIGTNSAEVAWRVGEKIAFGYLRIIDPDGSNEQLLSDGGAPQIMNSGKILFFADLISQGIYGINSIYSSGTGESTELSSYERSTLKLSFDNTKIVGGDLRDSGILGIWVTDISSGNSTKIR